MAVNWTTPSDLRSQVQRWWDRGLLLSELATGESSFPRKLSLKAPTSNEISENFDEVRSWISSLQTARHFRVEMKESCHRVFGRNLIPDEVWLDSLDEAIAAIGMKREVARFGSLIRITQSREPLLIPWLAKKPFDALKHHDDWDRLLDIAAWLRQHPRPMIYVRQVDIRGIDSKFIEAHRAILTEILDAVLPADQVDTFRSGVNHFNRRYGFLDKPVRIRYRILDSRCSPFGANALSDITLDTATFADINPSVTRVFITENEINFLSFPELANTIVIFGAGYGFEGLSQARWLSGCRIHYWGDIDTHGFNILSSARSRFPHIQSFLMDEETLLNHLHLAVEEEKTCPSEELPFLTPAEASLYQALKNHKWKRNLRLEQERICWDYVYSALSKLSQVVESSCLLT